MSSGSGFLGGYGDVPRSAYATPAELGAKPWALDFNEGSGWPSYPTQQRVRLDLEWQPSDWDPGLRFWSLPFDERLAEWLQDVDLAAPAVLAARQFAGQHQRWKARPVDAQVAPEGSSRYAWIDLADLAWRADRDGHHEAIDRELQALEDLMKTERALYLDETWLQSDNIPLYFIHLLNMDSVSKPWTAELIRCGLSIGNLVYMHYKAEFKRVRPSTLCPGLVPPWGPPRHPAFPSGHSFLGHFIALLLLEIPGVAQRYGVFDSTTTARAARPGDPVAGRRPAYADFAKQRYGQDMRSPLLWLSWRLAHNRERIGVHYPSDSSASRSLAAGVWQALFHDADESTLIAVPELQRVLGHASAEWPQAK